MKILLIDYDSKIPNLALKKIEKYHRDRGDDVWLNRASVRKEMDKIYASCIFDWNGQACQDEWPDAVIGGSGYNIMTMLPPEIEAIKPRINLGFTTRGCIRKCQFCIVPAKEGRIRAEGDLYDLWDGKAKEVVLLDNNILAMPEHFKMICAQARKENLVLDFNQGLDIRLVTDDLARELKTIRHLKDIRFAWDTIPEEANVRRGIEILKRAGIKRVMLYVLVGFNTTPEEDMYRLEQIRAMDQRAYIMRHKNVKGQRWYTDLAAWVNQQWAFQKIPFEKFRHMRAHRSEKT